MALFNNLYTASGDSACIEVGVSCNIRSENNVFQGIKNPVDASHAEARASSSRGNIGPSGASTNRGGSAFAPPYSYSPKRRLHSRRQSRPGQDPSRK